MYKDVSEKANYAKFAKLRERGMHTNPSLLAGDMKSGSEYMMYADMEPLAVKKFQVRRCQRFSLGGTVAGSSVITYSYHGHVCEKAGCLEGVRANKVLTRRFAPRPPHPHTELQGVRKHIP